MGAVSEGLGRDNVRRRGRGELRACVRTVILALGRIRRVPADIEDFALDGDVDWEVGIRACRRSTPLS